ncbi:PIN domain-containing protein [Calothrix sp. PCC 7507]|uniref:PIN domain-containing protein n=1 Tax=Calothrix sp. PCC 7507 TaxID=99598 RepID=UPI00029EE79D|nr:PIN domain-containing protein [Calothrix sp. PCC 7507]AFY30910.1 hypothetical protein Cal7507_0415 [Calothrix sp. PCC 7507]
MIRILVDADLILEALINCNNCVEDVRKLFDIAHPLIQMYITDVGKQKIYDYISRLRNTQIADLVIDWLQKKILICRIDQNILQKARFSPLTDFESAVELACVSERKLDAIVTHHRQNFAQTPNQFWVWSIADLWVRANLESQLQVNISS